MSCFALRDEGAGVRIDLVGARSSRSALGRARMHASHLRAVLPIGVCYYFCMVHVAAATGMLRGLIGGQAVAWQRFPRTPVSPV